MPKNQVKKIRTEFFRRLPKNGIAAEIGVLNGDNIHRIFDGANPEKLYLIDCWESSEEYDWDMDTLYQQVVDKWEKKEGITIIKEYSVPASKTFQDHYFDWVYIDASHEYHNVKLDLAHWLPKVKKGGFICGDDFTMRHDYYWPGVHGALIEFMLKYVEKDLETFKSLPKNWWLPKDKGGSTPNEIYEILKNSKWFYATDTTEMDKKAVDMSWTARSFIIEIGDWVDDLDYEKIIKESYEN